MPKPVKQRPSTKKGNSWWKRRTKKQKRLIKGALIAAGLGITATGLVYGLKSKKQRQCAEMLAKETWNTRGGHTHTGITNKKDFHQWALHGGHPDKGGDSEHFAIVSDCNDNKYYAKYHAKYHKGVSSSAKQRSPVGRSTPSSAKRRSPVGRSNPAPTQRPSLHEQINFSDGEIVTVEDVSSSDEDDVAAAPASGQHAPASPQRPPVAPVGRSPSASAQQAPTQSSAKDVCEKLTDTLLRKGVFPSLQRCRRRSHNKCTFSGNKCVLKPAKNAVGRKLTLHRKSYTPRHLLHVGREAVAAADKGAAKGKKIEQAVTMLQRRHRGKSVRNTRRKKPSTRNNTLRDSEEVITKDQGSSPVIGPIQNTLQSLRPQRKLTHRRPKSPIMSKALTPGPLAYTPEE